MPAADVDRDLEVIRPRAAWTERARREACRRVGEDGHTVAAVAAEFGVGWGTVMTAVRDYGLPLVDDPNRLERVHTLGVDETAFLAATPTSGTAFATGIVAFDGPPGCSTSCPVAAQKPYPLGFPPASRAGATTSRWPRWTRSLVMPPRCACYVHRRAWAGRAGGGAPQRPAEDEAGRRAPSSGLLMGGEDSRIPWWGANSSFHPNPLSVTYSSDRLCWPDRSCT